jgi:hypothetical protein
LDSWPLKMGPICCPKMSVRNYHYSLCSNTGERSSQYIGVFVSVGFRLEYWLARRKYTVDVIVM